MLAKSLLFHGCGYGAYPTKSQCGVDRAGPQMDVSGNPKRCNYHIFMLLQVLHAVALGLRFLLHHTLLLLIEPLPLLPGKRGHLQGGLPMAIVK